MNTANNDSEPRGLWTKALWMADQTPESRNRTVDFLRALSIIAVVLGHWIISAPYFSDGRPAYSHILDLAPWSQWLTWIFQVMPVFFFVGGFSNYISWQSAQRKNLGYRAWFDSRIRRLIGPVMPLIGMWAVMVAIAHANGVGPTMIFIASKVALIPVWFLAVYILVVAVVPLTHSAWQRWGIATIIAPIVGAGLIDIAFFTAHQHALGWLNYPFVWLAVHQMGYAWHDRRLAGLRTGMLLFVAGLGSLLAMTHLGPYPLSLVGVPSDAISNTLPPKLPLLALAAAQIGLILAFEAPLKRWLSRRVPWAATILVNGMIMTIFLWHSTVMMLLVGLAFWIWPPLLSAQPDSGLWWANRPVWLLAYAVATLPFLLTFSRFERPGKPGESTPIWRQLLGISITCLGLAMLAMGGIGGPEWLGLRWVPLLLPLIGYGVGTATTSSAPR
ncbi:MAG: acyltransferase [Acidobacteria bacterium]|nr:MAG: acyltransferase [Acidobacteriota bacterium]